MPFSAYLLTNVSHTHSREHFCELSEGVTDALCGVCSSWLLMVFPSTVAWGSFLAGPDSLSSSWIPMGEVLSNCDAVVQPLGLLRCLSLSCQAPTKLRPYVLIPWVKGTWLSQNQHHARHRQGRVPTHLCLAGLRKMSFLDSSSFAEKRRSL